MERLVNLYQIDTNYMQASKAPIQIHSNSEQRPGEQDRQETRKVSIIESTIRKQKNYFERIRGERQETKELNIHAKTLNQKYLKRCILANELNEGDKEIYGKYKIMRANFDSTKFLYESISQETKDMCRQYSKSSEIVKDVFKSDRMFFSNKLIFVKFLKKMELGIDKPNISWKQEYFKNKKKVEEEKKFDLPQIQTINYKNEIEVNLPQEEVEQKNEKTEIQKEEDKIQQNIEKPPIEVEEAQTIKNEEKPVRKKLFMKKISSVNSENRPKKQIPAFGQTKFGGGFMFSLNNKTE